MLPGQNVAGEVIVQEFLADQELNDPTPEELRHRLKPREWDVEEGTLIIEAALQNDGVEVRVEAQHVTKRLVPNDCAGEQRSAGRLSVELIDDTVD